MRFNSIDGRGWSEVCNGRWGGGIVEGPICRTGDGDQGIGIGLEEPS
jgi:hypothetical protein